MIIQTLASNSPISESIILRTIVKLVMESGCYHKSCNVGVGDNYLITKSVSGGIVIRPPCLVGCSQNMKVSESYSPTHHYVIQGVRKCQ